jgi:hypothetical protein
MKDAAILYISDGTFVWNKIPIQYANKRRLSVAVSEPLNSEKKRPKPSRTAYHER